MKMPSLPKRSNPAPRPAVARAAHVSRVPALVAGLLWLAAGLVAGYWALRVLGTAPVTPLASLPAGSVAVGVESVARALGAQAAPVAAAEAPAPLRSRYQLIGVVAALRRQGAALIAVNGQPPRPYRVGDRLDDAVVLQSVDRRTARLGPLRNGPSTVVLEVPPAPEGGA